MKSFNSIEKFCHHCICKTCSFAEVNGGTRGCGDCYKCLNEEYRLFCQSCREYYNRGSVKGMTLDYLYRKKIESGEMKFEEELVLPKEEVEKITEELIKSIKEHQKEIWGGNNENSS